MIDFVGKGETLDVDDIKNVADEMGVEEAALRAVLQVETGGRGFDVRKRPKALFERHVFYRELASQPDLQSDAVGSGLAYSKWGTRPYPPNSDGVYSEILAACDIDREAALRSTSWGLGQIMGSNHRVLGFNKAEDMVNDAMVSEENQLKQMVLFLKMNKILPLLAAKDWAGFARMYNGKEYAKNKYDVKLADAYDKFTA